MEERPYIPVWMQKCWCGKPAIGYHLYHNGISRGCEEHVHRTVLKMPPNSIRAELSYSGKEIGKFIRFPDSHPLYPQHNILYPPKHGDPINRYTTYSIYHSLFKSSSDYDYRWYIISKYTMFSKQYDEYIIDDNGRDIEICTNCGQSEVNAYIEFEREPHGEYLPSFWICPECGEKWFL